MWQLHATVEIYAWELLSEVLNRMEWEDGYCVEVYAGDDDYGKLESC